MTNVYAKLHSSYLKRKRILIYGCEEAVSLTMSKTEKNVETETRFFQWADDKLAKKKQAKQYY